MVTRRSMDGRARRFGRAWPSLWLACVFLLVAVTTNVAIARGEKYPGGDGADGAEDTARMAEAATREGRDTGAATTASHMTSTGTGARDACDTATDEHQTRSCRVTAGDDADGRHRDDVAKFMMSTGYDYVVAAPRSKAAASVAAVDGGRVGDSVGDGVNFSSPSSGTTTSDDEDAEPLVLDTQSFRPTLQGNTSIVLFRSVATRRIKRVRLEIRKALELLPPDLVNVVAEVDVKYDSLLRIRCEGVGTRARFFFLLFFGGVSLLGMLNSTCARLRYRRREKNTHTHTHEQLQCIHDKNCKAKTRTIHSAKYAHYGSACMGSSYGVPSGGCSGSMIRHTVYIQTIHKTQKEKHKSAFNLLS